MADWVTDGRALVELMDRTIEANNRFFSVPGRAGTAANDARGELARRQKYADAIIPKNTEYIGGHELPGDIAMFIAEETSHLSKLIGPAATAETLQEKNQY